MTKKFALLLTLWMTYHNVVGQNSQWQHIGVNQGLPQSHITSLIQDKHGYLWLGTNGSGLARFDGANFKVYNKKDSLASDFVSDIIVYKDSLFVGTHQGLSLVKNGRIQNYKAPRVHKIIAIDQAIYLATDSGIYWWRGDYLQPLKIDYAIDVHPVYDIAFYNNQFWIATSRGLWSSLSLQNEPNAVQQRRGNYATIVATQKGLLTAEANTGLYLLRENYFQRIANIKNIQNIVLNEQDIFIVSQDQGVFPCCEKDGNNQQIVPGKVLVKKVEDFLIDKDGNSWLATANHGLYKFTPNNFRHLTQTNGLVGSSIKAMLAEGDSLWIATEAKGLQLVSDSNWTAIKMKVLQEQNLNAMAKDPRGGIWVNSPSQGLQLLYRTSNGDTHTDPNKNVAVQLFGNQLVNVDKSVRGLWASNQALWIADGKQLHALYNQNRSIDSITSYGKNDGLKDPQINDIHGYNGKVWYITNKGNLGYIQNNRVFDYYQILGEKIRLNTLTSKGDYLYLGTAGLGIWAISVENPRELVRVQGQKPLSSNNVNQLVFDKQGYLWAGTEKGLNKILLENNSIKEVYYFNKNDGFTGVETTSKNAQLAKDGTIWFGTNNGLTKLLSSQNFDGLKSRPKIHFANISVNYTSIDTLDLDANIAELVLNHDENSLAFDYKTLDLQHPNGIEYSWRLNGSYAPWNHQTHVNFANLSPGNYTFEVKSRNRDWIESKPIQFAFRINKPWYWQSWFLLTLTASIVGITAMLVYSNMLRLKRRAKAKIEKLTLEKELINLEQKALQLQMNPHFIFNVLNGIKAMGSAGKLTQMNHTIHEFAALLRGVLQNSREAYVSVASELEIIKNYIQLEQKLSPISLNYQLEVDLAGLDREEVLIPSMLLQPFVENAVKHAFVGLEKNGDIFLELALKENRIACTIRDNGIGFKTAQSRKKASHKSVAIQVTKERLHSLIKYPNFRMDELMQDNTVTGTRVRFNIPYKTDY